MIVTFCGHADLHYNSDIEEQLLKAMEKAANGCSVTFYLGGYGAFDTLAKNCCMEYKERYGNAKLVFVTPYVDDKYLKQRKEQLQDYDEVLYPDLEKTPKRYAIIKRNMYMAEQADLLIAYVFRNWGGSYKMLQYAKSKHKQIVNFGDRINKFENI